MQRALQLAQLGLGHTYPNPMVGAVVVHHDRILGEGWHHKAGTPHAEVHAIESVIDKKLLSECTLYVSLEPCCHYGKTPPCTELILLSGIRKVVVATLDPNPLVAGKGVAQLRAQGIDVLVGLLEKEARYLNRRFWTQHLQQRPYVILKWAQSADGFMAPLQQNHGAPFWLSNPLSRQRVHQWRSQEAAVMVGTQTAYIDNPALTVRDWSGPQPLRVYIDAQQRIPRTHALRNGSTPTCVLTFTPDYELAPHMTAGLVNPQAEQAQAWLAALHAQQVSSVLVEGGAQTLRTFIASQFWDEARVVCTPHWLGQGVEAPKLIGQIVHEEILGTDSIKTIHPNDYEYHF